VSVDARRADTDRSSGEGRTEQSVVPRRTAIDFLALALALVLVLGEFGVLGFLGYLLARQIV
jgi:hypothetical protein